MGNDSPVIPVTEERKIALRDAALWFGLALTSIAVAGTLAIVLVVGRLPGLSEIIITDIDFAKRSLVVHVNLALGVWFFSFLAGLFCLLPGARRVRVSPVAMVLATVGTLLFCSCIFIDSASPILSNYVPALDHWAFLSGIFMFAAAVTLNFFDRRMIPGAARAPQIPREAGFGLRSAAFVYVIAMITFAGAWATSETSLLERTDGLTDADFRMRLHAYYEYLFWGGGHILQNANEIAMVSVWMILLSRVIKKPAVPPKAAAVLFLVLVLPTLMGPWWTFGEKPMYYFTELMRWSIFPAVTVFMIWSFVSVFRARPRLVKGDLKSPAFVGFVTSACMTVIGYLLGASIRGSDTLIPAHYHVAIGAVSAAFMAFMMTILVDYGRHYPSALMRKLATWQPLVFGIGQVIFAAGLAIAGAQRKVYGREQVVDTFERYTGLIIMGAGGVVALAGGIMFMVIVIRTVLKGKARQATA